MEWYRRHGPRFSFSGMKTNEGSLTVFDAGCRTGATTGSGGEGARVTAAAARARTERRASR